MAGYWRDPLANAGEPDTRQDPPARDTQRDYFGILSRMLGGIHWRAALVGYLAGSTGELLWRDTSRDPLVSYTGGLLWWDTRRDPLASRSGGILGGIHWRATGEQLWAGSTGEQLWRILGGIHWRAALAGYSAGSTGELLLQDTGWGRGVEASQTRIPT